MAAPIKNMRTIFPATVDTTVTTGGGSTSTTSAAVRKTTAMTTSVIANGATENDNIALVKTFQLLSVQVSVFARVRLYSTFAALLADASRPVGTPVAIGSMSGVITDLALTPAVGVLTWMMSPAALGFNDDLAESTTIYAAITNLSGVSNAITVTFTYLPLE